MNLEFIKSNPEKFSKTTTIKNLEKIIKLASEQYYGDEIPIISDYVYDILIDNLEKRDKDNKLLNAIGFKSTNDKEKLPYFMGSMNKIKTNDGIKSWVTKYNHMDKFVLSDKLDGISALYIKKEGTETLCTRGNGEYGRNINGIIKYLDLPENNENNEEIVLRGELIISNEKFEKHRKNYTSARSMVNGLVALKENTELTYILDFVVFEVIEPKLNPFNQLDYINKMGFKTPNYELINYNNIIDWKSEKDNFLLNKLNSYRFNSKYDIDGIIITHNNLYPRTTSNPKNSIAFKANNYGKITTIKDIIWTASKYNILIPRIKIEKVNLGSIVEYCTGFNGKYIFDNCLGPGSKIRVVLSGDVIPYIEEIIKSTYPKMPSGVSYKWDTNRLHLISLEENKELKIKKMIHFIKTIKIDFLSVGIVTKLYNGGFKDLPSILSIKKKQLLELEGFKETLSNKIYESIQSVISKPIYLGLLMTASLEFNSGFGIKRFKKIIDKYPNLMEEPISIEQITKIEGFQTKTASQFIDNLNKFKEFLIPFKLNYFTKIEKGSKNKNPIFYQKNIVLTGFRDPKFISIIEDNGGIIQNDVNIKTDLLIVKDITKDSSKIRKAKIIGTKIMELSSFQF